MEKARRVLRRPRRVHTRERSSGFPQVLESYLRDRRIAGRSPRTIRDYQDELTAFIKFLRSRCHSLDIREVASSDVTGYLAQLQDLGRAETTVNRAYGNIRAFFNWALKREMLGSNPCRHLDAPKVGKIVKPIMSNEQFQHLLSLCPLNRFTGSRRAAMLMLLRHSGIRLGELAGLMQTDLDWDHNRAKVVGKGNKERIVPLKPEVQRYMLNYLDYRDDDEPELWLGFQGPMTYAGIQKDLSKMFDRAGFRGVLKDSTHIYRRTWALGELEKGMDVVDLSVLGGWEDLGVLRKHYLSALSNEQALAAYERINKR